MSIPSAVFLDTSIFDGQQYNYLSTSLTTFREAANAKGVTLLLPDPTEREILRHIRERSDEALKALAEARKRAPFLAKWPHFPRDASALSWQVEGIASDEWRSFLAQFNVLRLDYTGVDIEDVMNRYDEIRPPFGEGKKRKEFPDAFAFVILERYAERSGHYIAVVSADADFRLACLRCPTLLHFQTLPALTETLLLDAGSQLAIREAIDSGLEVLGKHIEDEAKNLSFESPSRYEVTESHITGATPTDVRVVAIGADECTLTFEVEIESEHRFRWEEYDSDRDDLYVYDEWLIDTTELTGAAKVVLTADRKSIKSVSHVQFDTQSIYVDERPRMRHW